MAGELKGKTERGPAARRIRRGDWLGLQTQRESARKNGRDEVNRMRVGLWAVQRWDETYHRG